MPVRPGHMTPRGDTKHFAKCGRTRHYHRWYCREDNCEVRKKQKKEDTMETKIQLRKKLELLLLKRGFLYCKVPPTFTREQLEYHIKKLSE